MVGAEVVVSAVVDQSDLVLLAGLQLAAVESARGGGGMLVAVLGDKTYGGAGLDGQLPGHEAARILANDAHVDDAAGGAGDLGRACDARRTGGAGSACASAARCACASPTGRAGTAGSRDDN